MGIEHYIAHQCIVLEIGVDLLLKAVEDLLLEMVDD
jgi:hypothetical protein